MTSSSGGIDWVVVRGNLRKKLRRIRGAPSADPSAARDVYSMDDLIQEAITEQLAEWLSGAPVPDTPSDIEAELVIKATRRWKAWMKRAGERREKLDTFDRTLSMADMFDVICARDECGKFFEALVEAIDAEAQLLLRKLLAEGIPFENTKELATPPATSVAHVHNMKRRIMRQAKRVMTEMISKGHSGGAS
jgi:hypothetical protein